MGGVTGLPWPSLLCGVLTQMGLGGRQRMGTCAEGKGAGEVEPCRPLGSVGQQELHYMAFPHGWLCQAALLLGVRPIGNRLFLEGPEENVGGPCPEAPLPIREQSGGGRQL